MYDFQTAIVITAAQYTGNITDLFYSSGSAGFVVAIAVFLLLVTVIYTELSQTLQISEKSL